MFLKSRILILVSILWCLSAQAGEITVYTSLEPAEITAYIEAAKQNMPDLTIHTFRLSTGDLGARLLAESRRPKADVIWGWALTDMLNPKVLPMLETYKPSHFVQMPEKFKAEDGLWFAPTGYMAAFCVNTRRLKQKHLPMPTSWQDLTDPIFANEVVMPNPISSGTGYLQVVSILQGVGTQKGWSLLESINKNVGQYSKSGSKPCTMVSMGEYAIGASSAIAATEVIHQGYPVQMVIPSEGAGYELEANALMKASTHKKDAKRFLDWTLSATANQLYAQRKAIMWVKYQGGSLPESSNKLFDMDFAKSRKQRNQILADWRKRIEFAKASAKGS